MYGSIAEILSVLSKQVRAILDEAGFHDAKIMATSDLNEDRIAELIADGAPIDSFGVGTELATSFDAPAVSAVYKIAEIANATGKRYVAKYSSDKQTYPGAKQVFRYPERDIIGYSAECAPDVLNPARPDALLRPVICRRKSGRTATVLIRHPRILRASAQPDLARS